MQIVDRDLRKRHQQTILAHLVKCASTVNVQGYTTGQTSETMPYTTGPRRTADVNALRSASLPPSEVTQHRAIHRRAASGNVILLAIGIRYGITIS